MEWVLTTDALCKRYGHCKALDGCPCTCRKGRFTALSKERGGQNHIEYA